MDDLERESFVFYRSFFEAIKDLPPKDQATLFCAVCELALNGKEVELSGINKTIFTLIKPQIEANTRRYLNGIKGKDFGGLGGAPKGNQNAKKHYESSDFE